MNYIQQGKPVRKVLKTDLKSPVCSLKGSSVVQGYTYPSTQQTRYQAQLLIEPHLCESFLAEIDHLRHKETAAPFLLPVYSHTEQGDVITSGNFLMKFTAKQPPEIYEKRGDEAKKISPSHELPLESRCSVIFDVVAYLDKNEGNYKLTFPLKKICIYRESDEN